MKSLSYIISFALLSGPGDMTSYKKIFYPEYGSAVTFIEQSRKKLQSMESEHKDMMLAIVFPELIRFSLFRDFFETKVLELGYIEYGKEMVDFSIGRFQMKPSFVEKLEDHVKESKKLVKKYNKITQFKNSVAEDIRRERIERLGKLEWQIRYLECFYDIISERFGDIQWDDNLKKLKFYATAYNHDFNAPREEIEKWINVKAFPYGTNYKGKQYSYSEISTYFFINNLKTLKP
ncbi:MAG: hypothetical protein AABX80_00735 [Nanoarchaeota archaeon]